MLHTTTRGPGYAEGEYIADDDLAAAARVAMILDRPLLLTGEPGTGKSTFAGYVADHLGPAHFRAPDAAQPEPFPLHVFETKSTSVATDLFYRFDSLRRFHAAHVPAMSQRGIDYVTFEALGRAILESLPWRDVAHLVPQREHAGPRRSVVLIDEVDKAPRDFPNDLLNEIERLYFRIPELQDGVPAGDGPAAAGDASGRRIVTVAANRALLPIVILTSNSEKNLPAPFLRRCVFHHIRFPARDQSDRLEQIVRASLGGVDSLATSAVALFYDIREELQLEKPPTTRELVDWIRILRLEAPEAASAAVTELPQRLVKRTLGVLAKTTGDVEQVEALLAARGGGRKALA
jgi:MoxR-like ATPase